jgi:SSS family solute:Na+ symporter
VHPANLAAIAVYMVAMIAVGVHFARRQTRKDEYFVGDRKLGSGHIAMSVVATDVGGGFSIGLGGLGFIMGLSASWLLFTGLVGAWLSAVILVPKVKTLGDRYGWLTFPDFLEHRFDTRTRAVGAVVSAVGYAAFVGAQVLAGAKLSSAAFGIDMTTAVWVMAVVVVAYTALGGIQAVVYTDTIQWGVLLGGLSLIALPITWVKVGGLDGIIASVPPEHLSLTNISAMELLTWGVTIIPIWFVGMTLYQRIFACRDVKSAKRAWYMAGLLEYPLMAFLGATLGMMARILFPDADPEAGLPMLVREVLPLGAAGIVIAAYFAAIMSTADSCLLASVGNVVGDLYLRHINPQASDKRVLVLSRSLTVFIGVASVSVALLLPMVMDAVLMSYSFLVSGLFVPTLAGLLWSRTSATAAFWGILAGGGTAVLLNVFPAADPLGEPILLALPVSALVLIVLTIIYPRKGGVVDAPEGNWIPPVSRIEKEA